MISQKLINTIKKSFEREEVKQLLKNDYFGDYWYEVNKSSPISSTGFCYLVSVLIYCLDGKSENWMVRTITDESFIKENGKHYFLLNKKTNEVLDLTADQFNAIIPYEKSKGKPIRYADKNVKKYAKILDAKL